MHELLFALLTATSASYGVNRQVGLYPRETVWEKPVSEVVLVADGSGDWSGQAAGRIVEELKAKLEPACSLKIIWFDGDPVRHSGATIGGAHSDLVVVNPQVPLREAMELGFASLLDAPASRTMIVIAHAQFYPTSVSTRRLLRSVRQSNTRVHSIHMVPPAGSSPVLDRLGGLSRDGFVWVVETLAVGRRSFAGRSTAQLLQRMAKETGGEFCRTGPLPEDTNCVEEVASRVFEGFITATRLPAKR
jgi:hypothetical protein